MTTFLDFIGRKLLYLFRIVGEVLILLWRTLYSFREVPRNLSSIFSQMTIIGYETLPVASVMRQWRERSCTVTSPSLAIRLPSASFSSSMAI